jgi:hypothetical protein
MSEDSRQDWLSVLEAAASTPPDQMNDQWAWLLRELGLPEDYFLAILEALKQGRWRTAADPKAYLKTVAKREARRLGLVYDDSSELLLEADDLEAAAYATSMSEPLKGDDGVWRRREGWEEDYLDPRSHFTNYGDFLRSQVPAELKTVVKPPKSVKKRLDAINAKTPPDVYFRLLPRTVLAWESWAEKASLDEWERKVLRFHCEGVSRDRALAEQPDESSRKALQAAWRRFDRNGKQRLLKAAQK